MEQLPRVFENNVLKQKEMSKCGHENKVQMDFRFKPSGSDPRYNKYNAIINIML